MMNKIPDRKLNRLPEYDYSTPGLYFVTLCIHQRRHLLSRIENGRTELSMAGDICRNLWFDLLNRYTGIELDEFVIMPNHIHAIVYLPPENSSLSLSEIIGSYKSLAAREYYDRCNSRHITPVDKFWQRSFHDCIIRNEREYEAIKEYIRLNPMNWDQDTENLP
jgi:REP element-mobilizing transposase RayT